jgi:hypothetical protein
MKGFGESELKIDCQLNCSDEEHATNRRSEFMIVKNNRCFKRDDRKTSLFYLSILIHYPCTVSFFRNLQ